MEDKLKQEVAQIIEQILASKDDKERMDLTEKALEESASTIETLTSELEAANEQIESLNETVKAGEEARENMEKEHADAKAEAEKTTEDTAKEIEDLKAELQEKAEELDNIKKDAVASERMADLESAGVARDDKEAQTAKVREMSDEDYETYKEELVSVRASIMAELEAAKTNQEEEAAAADEQEENADGQENASEEEDGVETPPAEVNPDQTVQAALNMEVYPSDDLKKQYNDLGKTLAEAMTKDK